MSDDDTFLPRAATPAAARPAPKWAKKAPPKSKAAVRPPAKSTWRKAYAPRDRHAHAHTIADNVVDAWYRNYGGSSIEIPIGTVAGLALLRQPPETGNSLADWILGLQPHELPQLFKEIYLRTWIDRPHLINRALRLHDWAWNPEPDPQQLRAVHAVTEHAVNQGLFELTAMDDTYKRAETDILSPLLTQLRHKSDKKWRGEYHTPPSVADLMANMVVDKDYAQPGRAIADPAVGSGTMFRSVAQRLRDLGLNPHEYHWYGNDIDSLSAACAAINTIIWDLGPRVLIGCSDSLATQDGGYAQALADAKEAFEERDEYFGTAVSIAAFDRALRLTDRLIATPA